MPPTNGKLIKILTAAGLTGTTLMALGLLGYFIMSQNNLVGNHLNENTKALIELSASVDTSNIIQRETTQVLRELKEVIKYAR